MSVFNQSRESAVFKKILPVMSAVLICSLVLLFATSLYAEKGIRVSYLKGGVFSGKTQNGPWKHLITGATIKTGDFIKTDESGIAEFIMPDQSVVRLAQNTRLNLDQVSFPKEGLRKFSATLLVGKMCAKVAKAMAGFRGGEFSARTHTAVIGVRGTVYNLEAGDDKSTDISVYKGKVSVGPPSMVAGGPKEEMSWPKEVSEKKWEEIILGKLQRLHIGADGKPGKPQSFDPKKEKDEWVIWNQKRDAGK
jgi:hypothetical protein